MNETVIAQYRCTSTNHGICMIKLHEDSIVIEYPEFDIQHRRRTFKECINKECIDMNRLSIGLDGRLYFVVKHESCSVLEQPKLAEYLMGKFRLVDRGLRWEKPKHLNSDTVDSFATLDHVVGDVERRIMLKFLKKIDDRIKY